jgi:hypothetical protein
MDIDLSQTPTKANRGVSAAKEAEQNKAHANKTHAIAKKHGLADGMDGMDRVGLERKPGAE